MTSRHHEMLSKQITLFSVRRYADEAGILSHSETKSQIYLGVGENESEEPRKEEKSRSSFD